MKVKAQEYWLGDFAGYLEFMDSLTRIEEMTGAEIQAYSNAQDRDREEDREFGDMDYMMTRAGNVAIIDINGSLTNRNSQWNRHYGIVSYPEIKNAVIEAVNTDGIDSILLSIDSPGGAVTGISELSAFLNDVKQDHLSIDTHVGGSMNSGGYWLGSIGTDLTGTRLSQVGSIGVISIHMEYTKMFKKMGVEATVIRKGKYKALGNPYEKLTPEAKAIIEKDMEVVYDEFIATVATNRGVPESDVRNNMAEGQVFWGVEAKRVGLIDNIGTIDSVVTQMHNNHNASNSNGGSSFNAGEVSMGNQSTKVLTDSAVAAIAAGASVEDAASELGEEVVPAADGATASAEDTTDTSVDGGDKGGEGGEAANVETEIEDEGVEAAASGNVTAQVADNGVIDLLKSQLTDANKQVSDLQVEKAELKKSNDSLNATHEPLRKIAVESIGRMQVAIGSSPVDMSHVDASSVISQYTAVQGDFMKRFKVGASAEAENQDTEVVTDQGALGQAKVSATKISK